MNTEPFYFDDDDAENPAKEYRKFIEAHLNKVMPQPKTSVLARLRKKKESRNAPVQYKAKSFTHKKLIRAKNDISDSIDSFLVLCERNGLNTNGISPRSIEMACLGKDARHLPDSLVNLIISNQEIKQALGDLSVQLTLYWNGALQNRKHPATAFHVEANRMRRFYRSVAAAYWEKLEYLEKSVDSLGDASLDELRQMQGDLEGIASSVEKIASRIATEIRSRDAKAGALEKLARDPKQADKAAVRECWDLWQEDLSRYKGKAEFARDMMAKYESLKSAEVIARWCREWEGTTQPAK